MRTSGSRLRGVAHRLAETIAVEPKQDVGACRQAPATRIIGRTRRSDEVMQMANRASQHHTWTEEEFRVAAHTAGQAAEQVIADCFAWLERHAAQVAFGRGRLGPLYLTYAGLGGDLPAPAAVNAEGRVEILYVAVARAAPFDQADARLELNHRLNAIPGVKLDDRSAAAAGWPSIKAEALASEENRRAFFSALDWALGRMLAARSADLAAQRR
jgi:hypothetical protein